MNDFKLDKHKKIEAGFTTPDFYFDDFSKKVLEQLPKEEPKVISFWSRNKNWTYAAAAIVVVSLSIPMMNFLGTSSEEAKAAEIENYLTYHSNLTDEEIVEYLDESDINNIDIESTIETETIEQVLYDEVDLEHQITN
jgi:hypothetical protein